MVPRGWTPQEHPRLFFDPKDLEGLRAKRTTDDIARTLWRHVQEEIEKGMALETPRESPRWSGTPERTTRRL